MERLQRTKAAGRPRIYPFPWPRMAPVPNLTEFLAKRTRHIDAAVRAISEDRLIRPDLLAEDEGDLIDRFRLEEISLGETTIDSEVGQQQVAITDPRWLRPGETSRVLTVDVFTAMVPVGGDTNLLAFWPPNVQAPEPSERVWLDPRVPCIRIPALAELGDSGGASTSHFIQEQDATIRMLIAATNAAAAQWNADLPARIRELVEREKTRLAQRTSQRDSLGYPVATASARAIPFRLPRPQRTFRAPQALEGGDYPLLAHEDLAEVVAVMRRWADFVPEHPSVVEGKDENALRDELLHNLNTKWSGTAETFSKLGKTDIRVVVETATSTGISDLVFKAECKIWLDAGSATEAFDQLVERYLTNRETRAALIFFVTDRKLLSTARRRAVDRLVTRHGASELTEQLSGWPVLDVPHPEDANKTIRVVVAIVDATSPTTRQATQP